MKYIALLSIVLLVSGCENTTVHARFEGSYKGATGGVNIASTKDGKDIQPFVNVPLDGFFK